LWTHILRRGGKLIQNNIKIHKNNKKKQGKNQERRQFFRAMSALHQRVVVCQHFFV
jgi:hypothetical protein